jgi:conjugal transfer ATP-binding protein TraC
LDLYSNTAGNYNVACSGTSGAGKTVWLQDLIISYLAVGAVVRIIDVGGGYKNIIQQSGGIYLEFTRDNMPCLNPFTFVGVDSETTFEEEMQLLKPFICRMASPNDPLTSFQTSLIEQAIVETWKVHGNASEPHLVAQWLMTVVNENNQPERQAYELSKQLFPFTRDGQFGKIFNGPATIKLEGPIVGLELEQLKKTPELLAVVMFAITSLITKEMYELPRSVKKLCVFDEAWQTMGESEDAANTIEEGYRRARKYEGIFAMGTQGIDDFMATPAGRAAYKNADWKVFGRQDNGELDKLQQAKTINFSPQVLRMLKSLQKVDGKYSEWLITSPNSVAVLRCVLDPYFLTMASSKGPTFERIKYLTGIEKMTTWDAVSTVVKESGYAF